MLVQPFVLTILSTLVLSLLSLTGVAVLYVNKKFLHSNLLLLVALSAGTLMGSAFFHLIPEAATGLNLNNVNRFVVIAFVGFFLTEKLLQWHHHHEYEDEKHTVGYLNLIGDSFHNLLDGLIIAASFYTSVHLGLTTLLAVILHEIPQEIGDFGVLIHSGFSKNKAILANLLVSLTSLIGGIVGYLWVGFATNLSPVVNALAAGGFIYMAASDLLPEIRKEDDKGKSWATFAVFVTGVLLMLLFKD